MVNRRAKKTRLSGSSTLQSLRRRPRQTFLGGSEEEEAAGLPLDRNGSNPPK